MDIREEIREDGITGRHTKGPASRTAGRSASWYAKGSASWHTNWYETGGFKYAKRKGRLFFYF